MTTRSPAWTRPDLLLALGMLMLFAAGAATAQVPVDEEGNPIAGAEPVDPTAPVSDLPQRSMQELEELIGPIALYPDDLLAIVLPASTYPLEVVQAARFLEARETDSTLEPDESWDESVTALLNYPEVLRMMNEDVDWTWKLGEAVVAQQSDLIAAIEAFRDRAYAAGNLESDERQTVTRNEDDVVEIEPAEEDVIYVPYYEPEDVVVYQPRRVYHYYPRAYPVYYYPYPAGHYFLTDYFWGVTTAFSIGWHSNYLHVHHHSFHGHPYFGHHYYGHHWRRPSIHVFNNHYGFFGHHSRVDRFRHGSFWRPHWRGGARPDVSVARSRFFSNRRTSRSEDGYADEFRDRDRSDRSGRSSRSDFSGSERRGNRRDAGDSLRDRGRVQPGRHADRRDADRRDDDEPIRFRERGRAVSDDRDIATRIAPGSDARRGRAVTDNRVQRRIAQGNAREGRLSPRRADPVAEARQRQETITEARQRRETMARGQAQRESIARSSRQPSISRDSSPRRSTFSSSSRSRSSSTPSRSTPSQRAAAPRSSNRSSASGSRRSNSSNSSSERRSSSSFGSSRRSNDGSRRNRR